MRTALLTGLLVTILWWVSAEHSQRAGRATGNESSGRFFGGRWFPREGRVSDEERQALREEARSMFDFGFHNYLQHGFPKDDVRPISCRGHDSQGGIAITLIDALDTLLVMDREEHLVSAVHWLDINLSFDLDARVHVFELTIRALGGLLSTHILLVNNPAIMPDYNGCLLRLATELGDRLLPAFDTPYGIPLSWVNLRKGLPDQETRVTCTACAGTLLLEFGLLSRLTRDPVYEDKARAAAVQVYRMRSTKTGLLGNTLNVDELQWVRYDASIGAGTDSFYEYLLKAYLLFGDEEYLGMFRSLYVAAMRHLRPNEPGWAAKGWLGEVHLHNGIVTRPWISSLSAFWPGLQATIGQVRDAATLHGNWTAAWKEFGWLPELFDASATQRHPSQTGYPLRPELIESTYLLHSATGDAKYLEAGRLFQSTLVERNRQRCGYASTADVATGALEDTMESFFLSETTKYLYLLHTNASALPDFYVFSTEGHILPVLPSEEPSHHRSDSQSPEGKWMHPNCRELCRVHNRMELLQSTEELHEAFPALKPHTDDATTLWHRRCHACEVVSEAMAAVPPPGSRNGSRAGACEGDACAAEGGPASVSIPHLLCRLQEEDEDKLKCFHMEVISEQHDMDALPKDAVIIQFMDSSSAPAAAVPMLAASDIAELIVKGQDGAGNAMEITVQGATASFGAPLGNLTCAGGADTPCNVTGRVAEGQPRDGCAPLHSSDATRGSIVVLDRGKCMFAAKVLAAEEAGAVAAIIINSEHTMMPMGEDDRYSPTIPSIHIPLAAGQALMDALAASSGGLWGTLRSLPAQQARSGPKAAAAQTAPAVAGPQPLQDSQAASTSSDQCGEGSESVREQRGAGRTQEMGIDDYYSPEDDTEEAGEGEGQVREGTCLLDSFPLSTRAGEGRARPAGPLPGQQGEEQGVSQDHREGVVGEGAGETAGDGAGQQGHDNSKVKPGGPISALGRLLNGLLGRSKGTQDHATEVEEGNAGLDAGGELTAKLGRTEAERVARAALAAATAVMQAKRVEILVPPQAAAWLQEDGQLGKVVDIGGAVNTMVMHLARANLAGTIQQVAASAMGLQQKLEVDRARQKQQQQ